MKLLSLILFILLVSCSSNKKETKKSGQTGSGSSFSDKYSYFNNIKNAKKSKASLDRCIYTKNIKYLENLKKELSELKDTEKIAIAKTSIAICEQHRKQYKQAIYEYNQVLSITKNELLKSIIHNNLGVIYSEFSRYDLADEYYKKSIKNDTNIIARFNQGTLSFESGNKNGLLRSISKLMNFQTDDDYYNLQLAHFLLETKNLNKSNEYFRKISKKNLKDKDIISNYVISFILDDEKYQSVYNKNKKEIESHQYFKMLKNNLAQSSKKEKEDE